MGFLKKVQGDWEEEKKKLPEHKKTQLDLFSKQDDFKSKTMYLIGSIESWLTDLEDCPDEDDDPKVKVYKQGVDKILEGAKTIKKLADEWEHLSKKHTDQLLKD
jgi:hypothetical protein